MAGQQVGENAQDQANRPGLRVYLLGRPQVTWAGDPLYIPRRQARAIFYRLAARLNPITREELCFLLWPDIPDALARRNLTRLLTHLRLALPAPDIIFTRGDRVTLNPDLVWSDTLAFEQLCAQADPSAGLKQAVALYQGSFLAGFSLPESPELEAWARQEQQVLERCYLKALSLLSDHHSAAGQYAAAIDCCLRYLEIDLLAEEVHRRLIVLYAANGDRGAALRQFEIGMAVLERELGVSPLPETRAVYRTVLEGGPLPIQPGPVKPAWTTVPSLQVPLVGRDDALASLRRAFANAQGAQSQVVLLHGEPGIGKSRLLEEFARQIGDQALVLAGNGQPNTRRLPYQPLLQALRPALQGPQAVAAVDPTWLAEAARLLPELQILRPDLPPPWPVQPDEARVRLFEALCQLVLGLAAKGLPVVLCLDNLQWIDRATLDWLAFFNHRFSGHRLLLLGTYRSEEKRSISDLHNSLAQGGTLSQVELLGLKTAEILQLLRHLDGTMPGDDRLAHRLQSATGGNPLFLLETLRSIMEAGRPLSSLIQLHSLPLVSSVRDAVTTRLDRLQPLAKQVIEAGAVLGPSFSFELVQLTAGRRELEAIDGLDELVARQLLVEQRSAYHFPHDLTRRTVIATLSPVRRQLLHRRAAQALERLQGQATAALAYHFEHGGELERALYYHGLAAEAAIALFAWQEAEEHQDRMLGLLHDLDPQCSNPKCRMQQAQILSTRAHLHALQGRQEERDSDLRKLVLLAQTGEDDRLRLHVCFHQVRHLNQDGYYAQAIEVAEAGLQVAERLSDIVGYSRLLAQIGYAHILLGQPRRALQVLESALSGLTDLNDPIAKGRVHRNLGYLHIHLGDLSQALFHHQTACTYHEAAGDLHRLAWDILDVGLVYLKQGDCVQAKAQVDRGLELAQRIGAQPAQAYGSTIQGYLELHQGYYDRAAQCFQEAIPMYQSRPEVSSAQAGLGTALYHMAERAPARMWLTQAATTARNAGHQRGVAVALVGLGLLELDEGQLPAASACFADGLELARSVESTENSVFCLAGLARVARLQEHLDLAVEKATKALQLNKRQPQGTGEMWAHMELGLALLAQGQLTAALEHTSQASSLTTRAHQAWIRPDQVSTAHQRVLQAIANT